MNRSIFIFIFVLLASITFGAKKTSITNGNWNDPSIWSPAGVPANLSDSLIINSNVTFTQTLNYTVTLIWVKPGFSLSSINDSVILYGNLQNDGLLNTISLIAGNGISSVNSGTISGYKYDDANVNITNTGTLSSDTIIFSGSLVNNAKIQCTQFFTSSSTLNNNSIIASNLLSISASFTNATGSSINAQNDLMVSGNFLINSGSSVSSLSLFVNSTINNNGNVITGGLTNGSGTLTGMGGKYCISSCFINTSVITGSIDICDATPGSLCDINAGTITGTITNCAAGPCQITGINGNEMLSDSYFRVFPNPSSEWLIIDTNSPLLSEITLFNTEGQAVITKECKGIQQINVKELPSGIYQLRIKCGDRVQTSKLVLKGN